MGEKKITESTLKIFRAKQSTLFQRIQRIYDLSKGIEDKQISRQFEISYRLIPKTLTEYAEVEFKINELEMELDPEYKPTFNDSHIEMIEYVEAAAEKLAIQKQVSAATAVHGTPLSVPSTSKAEIRLPKIELPCFRGDQAQWSVFYEMFKSLVHENQSLSDQQKVQYLVSKLTGDASNICKHLPPVATNYLVIWNALQKRYNDPRAQANSYLEQIFEFKPLKSESRGGLSSVLDKFCGPITALKRLNAEDLADLIFLNRGLKILDPVSRRTFEAAVRDKDIPTYEDFVAFVEKQIKTLPWENDSSTPRADKPIKNYRPKIFVAQTGGSTSNNLNKNTNCLKCNQGSHQLVDCRVFLKMSPWDRFRFIKQKACCLKCFSSNHLAPNCKKVNPCLQCSKPHHSLLHFEFSKNSPESVNATVENQQDSSINCCSMANYKDRFSAKRSSVVLLSTAVVNLWNGGGEMHDARFLIDSGSQCHFLTAKACRKLKLPISPFKTSVVGFGGGVNPVVGKTVCSFGSKSNPEISFTIEPLVVDKIVEKLPSSEIDRSQLSYLKSLKLADEKFYLPGDIDGIIGAELVPHLLKENKYRGKPYQLMAVDSVLGWILMGKAPVLDQPSDGINCMSICHSSLDSLVRRFWEIEEVPNLVTCLSPGESDCENIFKSSVRRLESGRFVVSLPFQEHPDRLGDSFEMAKRRFINLERRLDRDPDSRALYHDVILDYLRQGHMSMVTNPMDRPGYYIPHHGIFKSTSSSTPLRIVFDASAKTTTHLSLNDVLHVGPKLQTDIFLLLLHFRLFPIALTADIKQMYRQILIEESHRRFQRVLWRFSTEDPVEIYELNCVVFGITSSPYLALRTVRQLVEEEGKNFPATKDRIPNDMYMDDLITSVPSLSEADQLYHQTKLLFENGGFMFTKWASNSSEMLSLFTEEDKSFSAKDFETGTSLAVLGLEWQPSTDNFRFRVNHEHKDGTKRNILSSVARIFDPLGLLAPLTLFLKCLIKELWRLGLDWDQVPPAAIATPWERCQRELVVLSNLAVLRHIGVVVDSRVTLIGFCDASEMGYGAVIYLKAQTGQESVQVSLLCGKSKVAPAKVLTIPRLELCAALLLANLMHTTASTLRTRCQVDRIVALSDSTVALHWIKASPSRWQTFVAHRVSKIQDCGIDNWMHVSGAENPADCLSRGLTPCELVDHTLWWNGPIWLGSEESCWPVKLDVEELDNPPEVKISNILTVVRSEKIEENAICALVDRCSNYLRLLRTMVLVLRFVRILPSQMRGGERDLDTAEMYLCRVVQKLHFPQEFDRLTKGEPCSPKLQRLSPFLDRGIIRVGGRLENADIGFDSCHPIVLPKKDPLVIRLIDYYHKENCHAGPHLLLSLIRQKFWIISAREIIRSRIRNCNRCFRFRPSVAPPKMGNLPTCRVTQCKPFEQTGVDYAGPIRITMARKRNPFIFKAYICLFICMSTKAAHIELVSDLSTSMFLAAFRRFLSRRGPCRVIYSDCGTNFVGAHEQLSKWLNSSEYQDALTNQLLEHRIEWKFIPPGAPHFGGIWEANIKSVKSHLFRVIGTQLLTYEELNTVLVQIEAVLNSRPLCPLSSDPGEPLALTPAHFLNLTPLKYLPAQDVQNISVNRLTRYELVNQLVQSFWNRWRKEYLHELQTRHKWTKPSDSLSVGTIVIVDQPNLPPLKWPIGVIEEVFPGTDGVVRVALVRVATGRYKRPATKLYPLPTQ